MTKGENRALYYFLPRSLGLGIGISTLFNISGKDAWIAIIIGSLIGLFIISLITYLSKSNIIDSLKKNSVFNMLIKVTYFIFIAIVLITVFSSLTSLVTTFFLPNTPALMISIPFVILLLMLGERGMKILTRVALILFAVSFTINIIKTLLLIRYSDISLFLPVLTTNIKDLFLASAIYGLLSTAPIVMLINEKSSYKENIKNYLFCSFISLIIIGSILSVLGAELAATFSYPEYVVLRKIKFFNFLENIENIIATIWLADLFVTQAVIVTKAKDIFNKWFVYGVVIGLVLFVDLYILPRFSSLMVIYNYSSYAIMISLTVLLIMLLIKNISIKKSDTKSLKST